MVLDALNDKRTQIFYGLCFAFPVLFGTVKSWHSSLFLVACLFGLLLLKGTAWDEIPKGLKLFFYAVIVFLLAAVASLVNADDLGQGIKRLTKLSYLLGFFVLTIGAAKVKVDLSIAYLKGICLGSFVLFGVAIYQTFLLGFGRAQGITNAIVFGDVAMLFAVILFVSLVYKDGNSHWLLLSLSLAAALGASLLSGARGGWLVLPVALFFLSMLMGKAFFCRRNLVVVGFVMLLLAGGAISFNDQIGPRLSQVFVNFKDFSTGQNLNTSLGHRILMWGIAWEQFQQNPLVGSGLGDFKHDSIAAMSAGKTQLNHEYSHAHSIYFEMLGNAGSLGMLSMLVALIVVPVGLFFRGWQNSANDCQRRVALTGLLIVVSFAIFGLTESWVSRSPFMIVYSFSLFVFYSSLRFLSSSERI
ncbi:O-antigen ligase family protein [Desulfuromonas sp. AOP6]|uniref:O-antigen ligase family protein n=1 Tax=Desulfuromonas sp. AOP6 TaxID=1566351 RepID=UPI001287470B|nr:O-antigen ligase family protein [Desulfuromonas sp. AOP6]BCA80112.1 hypothetical protein AOP6_1899 [Desulfuromonas sp. AOP6]